MLPDLSDPNKRRDYFLIAVSLLLFTLCLLRAIFVPFSTDENGSYNMYVFNDVFLLHHYDEHAANHHLLNSWLMWCSEKIFGNSEWALRLPNLIGGALYFWSTAMIARRFQPPLLGAGIFLVLNLHPYLLMYFALARGYGLAIGLMAFAIERLLRYTDETRALKDAIIGLLAASLALLASFTQINVFLPYVGLLLFFAVLRGSAQRRLSHMALILLIAGVVLVFVIPIFLHLRDARALFSFATNGFWSDTVYSLTLTELMGDPGKSSWFMPLVTTTKVIVIVAGILILWKFFRDRHSGVRGMFHPAVLIFLLLAGLSVVLQFQLLGTQYVMMRMALFFVPLFFLVFALAIDALPGPRIVPIILTCILSGLLAINFVTQYNLSRCCGWLLGDDNKVVVKLLEEERVKLPAGARLRVGVDPEFMNVGLWYYRNTFRMPGIDVTTESATLTNPGNDFLYLNIASRKLANDSDWTLYREFPVTGNVLFIRKKHDALPKELYNTRYDLENSKTPWVNAAAAHDGKYGARIDEKTTHAEFGLDVADSVTVSGPLLADVTMHVRFGTHTDTRLYLSCTRNGKEFFVHMDLFPSLVAGNGEWQALHTQIVLPNDIRRGDRLNVNIQSINHKPLDLDNLRIALVQLQHPDARAAK